MQAFFFFLKINLRQSNIPHRSHRSNHIFDVRYLASNCCLVLKKSILITNDNYTVSTAIQNLNLILYKTKCCLNLSEISNLDLTENPQFDLI